MAGTRNGTTTSRAAAAPPLPDRAAFTDAAVLRRERERVFGACWQLLGFTAEFPDAGDYAVRRMGGDEVVVVRDERGAINVLLNSCTHRGTQLCRASFGNAAHFRCSYHGWTFANDGRLVGVPALRTSYPPGFAKSRHDLPRARVAEYRGFVFATWCAEAAELVDHLGEFRWYLDAMLDLPGCGWEVCGPPQRVVAQGNWKLLTDNFAGDGYHLGTAHRAAFDQGLFSDELTDGTLGRRGSELLAANLATAGGHALRAGYVVPAGTRTLPVPDPPAYPGYPESEWARFTAAQTDEQMRFNSHCHVVHGVVFPNTAFLSVSQDPVLGREGEPVTRYTVWRTHVPLDAHRTECTYWTLVPTGLSAEWKRRSRAYQARSQSAGGLLFEVDDMANFAALDRAVGDSAAPTDLSLGLQRDRPAADFPGPGSARYGALSEHNQRAFYRRWHELVEPGR